MTDSEDKPSGTGSVEQGHESDLPGIDARRLRLALAQFPARLRRARRQFRKLTGLTAVTSVRSAIGELDEAISLRPPVHPSCIERIRSGVDAPCEQQWAAHVRSSLRSRRGHSHTCPLGLRCSCVPIYLGETLVGVAKVVADSRTSADSFASATTTLALAVSGVCQEAHASVLWDELNALRQRVRGFQRIESHGIPPAGTIQRRTKLPGGGRESIDHGTVVDRALDYLHQHYRDTDLSLGAVAAALKCNSNYLTQRFTQLVGQRMHSYIIALRVDRASRQLLETDAPIKQIALESGFRDSAALSRVFHRQVGVSPSGYRQIFAGS